jgi:hypothetical protein
LTKFEPLPAGPYYFSFGLDRESIVNFDDESLEMEIIWVKEFCEVPIVEFIRKDSIDKHGSFILDLPDQPCSHHAFPESAMFSALSTFKGYNHLLVLYCKMFRRLIVDAYVYHKHCRFCVCIAYVYHK